MIKTIQGFMRGMMSLTAWWWPWIGLLMGLNFIAPWFFLGHTAAVATLVAFLIAATIQMVLFRRYGFVRLLGAGHLVPWTILLPYLALQIPQVDLSTPFGIWLVALVACDGLSYVIDVVDVVRWVRGEREPAVTLDDVPG